MSDEEVIKRRLLIDGDGTGDDKRLNMVLKILTKWSHSSERSVVENQLLFDRMLWQLGLCEFSVKKSQTLTKTISKQQQKYKEVQMKLEAEIENTKNTIEKSKKNLVQAKVWKQNHMMYDLLAQSIVQQPARKETNEMLNNLQAELKELKDQSKDLEEKLNLRKKQFHVLVNSANQLRTMLEEAENEVPVITLDDIANSPDAEPMSE